MTTPRDPDLLLQAFLDEGPEVLPDRVLEAVQGDVHRMRQRASGIGPWRFLTMRTLLASAAVVAVLAIGGGVLWATRSPEPPIGSEPSATPSPWSDSLPWGILIPGTTYFASDFGEPFRFTLPEGLGLSDLEGDIWDTNSFRLRPKPFGQGAITFHDDARLSDDICHPTGVLDDIPASVEAVGAWLEASRGLSVSDPVSLETADGKEAKYWNIELGPNCFSGSDAPGGPVINFSALERHRVYAVPSGDDVIIIFTWGAGYCGEGDQALGVLNPYTDGLVHSIEFAPILQRQ